MQRSIGTEQDRVAVLAAARSLFPGPGLVRRIQRMRPRICPFEILVSETPFGARVLDVGCGAGLFLGLLARLRTVGPSVGFDASAAAIAVALDMAAGLPAATRPRFEVHAADAPWPEGSFEVVSIVDVLHHIDPDAQEAVVRRATKRVCPGGRCIYKDMAPRPLVYAFANRLHDLVLARQWIHYVPLDRVIGWVEAEGLRLSRREIATRLWYRHEMAIFDRPLA